MSKKTILVVDDDPMFLQMIELYLSRQGYRVVTALDGSEGLRLVKTEEPKVIILDIMMPGISGYDVCKQLRNDPETADIPILMLTAKSRLVDKIEGFRAGTDEYLTKPIELAELLARMKALLARSSRSQNRAGRVIVFWGAKGGLGVSTLAVNVGVAMAQQQQEALLLDLHPGFGTSAELFGLRPANSLATMLRERPFFDQQDVAQNMVRHGSGLRILFGGKDPAVTGRLTPELTMTLLGIVQQIANPVLVDLPAGLHIFTQVTLLAASQIVLVTEGRPTSLNTTENRIRWLLGKGLSPEELGLVVINRTNSALVSQADEIRSRLGINLLSSVPPAGEAIYAAEEAGYPVILHDIDGMITHSIRRIAGQLMGGTRPGRSLESQASVGGEQILSKRHRGFQ